MKAPNLKTFTLCCSALLTVAAVTVSLVLVELRGQERAGQTEETEAVQTAQPSPAPSPSATPAPTETETREMLPTEPPPETPTPYITPPADTGIPSSGSDIILTPISPASDGNLNAPPASGSSAQG